MYVEGDREVVQEDLGMSRSKMNYVKKNGKSMPRKANFGQWNLQSDTDSSYDM